MRKGLVLVLLATITVLANAGTASAEPPSNDDISAATEVTSLPFTDVVNTGEATVSATDNILGAESCSTATLWYRFTPAESGEIEISTFESDYDTTLALFSGDPDALTLLQCVDDSALGFQSQIIAEVTAGETYYISAGTCCFGEIGQVGPGGNLVLIVREAAPPVTTVSVTGLRATVDHDGVVIFTGTIECDQLAYGHVYVGIRQRFARNIAEGAADASMTCGPEPTVWSAENSSYTGTMFGPGNATFTVYAWAYGVTTGYAESDFTDRLHLRRGR